jgi:pyrimidine oxygenase
VSRLLDAAALTGRKVGAYTLVTIIADRTDEMAFAKWDYYNQGVDLEAIEWMGQQSGADKISASTSTAARMAAGAAEILKDPKKATANGGPKLIGSYENVARMLDVIAEQPGIEGIMLIFDDFIVGMEQFGEHIQPLMKSRNPQLVAERSAA